jgi:GT2 family glycosyltransferase
LSGAVTIVLPLYNVERSLLRDLPVLLELGFCLGRPLSIVLVDDGSTDGTYEAACELTRRYPQLALFRQPSRRGLGAALALVHRRLGVPYVIAHDGVNPICVEELASLLREQPSRVARPLSLEHDLFGEGRRARRLVTLASRTNGASFRWLRLDEAAMPRRSHTTPAPVTSVFKGMASTICSA